ncbi:9117_t:CDS:1, partial [Acaulospora colombiana]
MEETLQEDHQSTTTAIERTVLLNWIKLKLDDIATITITTPNILEKITMLKEEPLLATTIGRKNILLMNTEAHQKP